MMLERYLYLASLIICAVTAALLVQTSRLKRELRRRRAWKDSEIQRALQMLQSSDTKEVLVAFELLAALDNPKRAEGVARLQELMRSGDQRVASTAFSAMMKGTKAGRQ